MDLESIFLLQCASCDDLLVHDNLKVHSCGSLICVNCKDKESTCKTCGKDFKDDNFLQISPIMNCFYFFDCKSYADGYCKCVNNNLCQKHIIQVHQNINKEPCNPIYHHAHEAKKNCENCSTMKAQFKNRETGQEICINCAVNLDKSLIMTLPETVKDFHETLESEKNHVEELLTIIENGFEILKEKMNQERKHFAENLAPILSFFQGSMTRNEELISKLEIKIQQSRNKFRRFSVNMKIIQSIIDEVMKYGLISHEDYIQKAKVWLSTLTQDSMNHEFQFLCSSIIISGNIEDLKKANTKLTFIITNDETPNETSFSDDHGQDSGNNTAELEECSNSTESIFQSMDEPWPKESRNEELAAASYDTEMSLPNNENSPILKLDSLDSTDISGFQILKVTNVRDPAWIHIEEPEMVNVRNKIIETCLELQDNYFEPVEVIKQGDIVIIKDHPSFKEPIKRGQIVCYNLARKKWKVKLLDYGKSIEIDKKQIYHANHDIFKCGSTVFKAKLVGVKPRSKSIYLDKPKNNAAYLIKTSLIPNTELVYVKKIIQDGDSWFCLIKSMMNETIIDWSKTIISHNLAIAMIDDNGVPSCDMVGNNYCYLYHFYGKCNGFCNRWHVCSWCNSVAHPLCKCKSYIDEETKITTGFISQD